VRYAEDAGVCRTTREGQRNCKLRGWRRGRERNGLCNPKNQSAGLAAEALSCRPESGQHAVGGLRGAPAIPGDLESEVAVCSATRDGL